LLNSEVIPICYGRKKHWSEAIPICYDRKAIYNRWPTVDISNNRQVVVLLLNILKYKWTVKIFFKKYLHYSKYHINNFTVLNVLMSWFTSHKGGVSMVMMTKSSCIRMKNK
jgi:hypothetical protein